MSTKRTNLITCSFGLLLCGTVVPDTCSTRHPACTKSTQLLFCSTQVVMELFGEFDDDMFTGSRSKEETRPKLVSYNAKFCEREVKKLLSSVTVFRYNFQCLTSWRPAPVKNFLVSWSVRRNNGQSPSMTTPQPIDSQDSIHGVLSLALVDT